MVERANLPITLGAESTYPKALLQKLSESRSLLENWYNREQYLDDLTDEDSLESILRDNKFTNPKIDLTHEVLPSLLRSQSVRCVHYTRLLKTEVKDIRCNGLRHTSLSLLDRKLNSAKAEGNIDADDAHLLKASSVLNSNGRQRPEEVCFVTQPIAHSDGGISPLLSQWGGEMVHFARHDGSIRQMLKTIGLPAIVEVNLCLSEGVRNSRIADCLANLEIQKFAEWSEPVFAELHVNRAISAGEVIDIHCEGSETFNKMSTGRWP